MTDLPRPNPANLPPLDTRLLDEPMSRFGLWWQHARDSGTLEEPAAMVLATADADGTPSARVVLLRAVDERGFVFYTNLNSRKGRELRARARAALVFYWERLHRQVRVEGDVVEVSPEEADAYFASRPRDSRVSAWASQQSEPIDDEATLLWRIEDVDQHYGDRPIPRPPHWSGLRVVPTRIEFWQEGPFRRHRRDRYDRAGGAWTRTLLQP